MAEQWNEHKVPINWSMATFNGLLCLKRGLKPAEDHQRRSYTTAKSEFFKDGVEKLSRGALGPNVSLRLSKKVIKAA